MSWAIWITGPTGSGKSTLARALTAALERRGRMVRLLALEEVARELGLGPPLASGNEPLVYRALVYSARLLTDAGIAVVIDAAAPRRAWRELARRSLPSYAEVELVCPPEVCGERAQTARWRSPGQPGAPDWLVELPYERSLSPDLTVFTEFTSVWSAVDELLQLAERVAREQGLHGREEAGIPAPRPEPA
jgi:adenylylsulfate kinase